MEHKGTIRIETDRLVLKRHVLDDAEIMFKNWVTEKDAFIWFECLWWRCQ